MPLSIDRKLPIILLFVVIVVTALGLAFYQYTTSLQDAVDLEKQAQGVVSKLDDTLHLTLGMESAVNGFVITGNDTYLDPYQKAKPKIAQNLANLKLMIAGSQAELEDVTRLEGWANQYIAQSDGKIETRKVDGFDLAITTLSRSSDRVTTANMRATIERIKGSVLTSLQQQERQLDRKFNQTAWILIIGCGLGIVALGFANVVVSREFGKRSLAEKALTAANKGLEERIEERTRELADANSSLQQVAVEREELLKNEQSARREAEIANRLRDEFMATISHELKTPLNSILGWARMLKVGGLDEAQTTRALTTIIKNSETQNRLIEDLLDVARIVSGKLVLKVERVNAVEVVRDSIETVRPSADEKQIEINYHVEPYVLGVVIDGDRSRLTQVFSNLLTNAVKFTPPGGCVDVSILSDSGDLSIGVKDTGVGISSDFLPVVFERFRQDSSNPERNNGLGLGLAIVRQLVEMHGGRVEVSSEGYGKGSKFTVTFPARQRADLRQAHQVSG